MILPAPLITKRILDHSLPKKDVTELIVLVVITLLLLVVIRLVSYATRMLFLKVNTKAIVDIRKDTLKKLFKLPYNQYHQYNTGYYISRINDDSERIQVLFTDTLTSILQDILTFIVGACAIVCINWKLAIAVMIPFYGYLMLYFTSKARALSKTYYQNRSQVNSELSEALDTYDLSKVFSNLWYSIRRYYGVAVCEYRAYVKLNRVMMANDTTINVLAGLSPLIIVGYGGYEVIQGRMTIGSLIAFKTFSNYLFGPTNRLLNINLHLQKALISLDRIISIFKAFEETPDPNFQMPNHINCLKISNVRFSFPADESTIFEFNLSVRKGECIGIVGKSGSGKTTLIRIILGLYPVYEGQIILDGYSLSPSQVLSLRNRISLVEQEPQLFNDTVYQNIRFANHLATDEQIIKAAEDAHADCFIRKLDKSYDTIISADMLSVGEKQRLAIARALVRNPALIIFDEATSNIDPISETIICNTISKLPEDTIVFIISHRMKLVQCCNRVIVIDSGRIIETGTPDELSTRDGLYKVLLNHSDL
jgi:subfamily B ATP-binding cassette protein MsbA